MANKEVEFLDYFKEIVDHRVERQKLYTIEEILLLTFCGVISGCDSWDDLEDYGKTKLDHLRSYLPYKNGTPSDDTLRRFFRVLDPEAFEQCFMNWVKSFRIDYAEKIIAIDGKTSRRSFDGANRPMHLISAFASELGITLGQLKTEDKSNEITAIPALIDILDIEGATITIDAMGCQSKIVEKIINKKANYLIGLKGNQGTLNADVRLLFENKPKNMVFMAAEEIDKGHGRIETRRCTVTEDIKWLQEQHPQWCGLKSIVEIDSQREIKGEIATEKRYYISSLPAEPTAILKTVRQHWGVEKLHWILDMTFGDDQSRIRKGNAPRNMAVIKKTTLNLLSFMKKSMPRLSLKRMRKKAGWDNQFLDEVLDLTIKF